LKKNWYEEWFSSKLYQELYQHRNDEDARQIINLLQRSIPIDTRSKVLDIACGAGRHSLELARRGFEVTGLDLSKFLISEAKKNLKNAKEKNLHVKFFIKDMRNFNFRNSFDIAVNIFTSFGYFENDRENFRVIENVSRSLKKKGYFLFDFLNKSYLEKNLVTFSKKKIGQHVMKQKRRIENGFVKKDILIESKDKILRFEEMLKLYSAAEFKTAFKSYGLVIKNLFGDYYGNKFLENKSQRLIVIAQKS